MMVSLRSPVPRMARTTRFSGIPELPSAILANPSRQRTAMQRARTIGRRDAEAVVAWIGPTVFTPRLQPATSGAARDLPALTSPSLERPSRAQVLAMLEAFVHDPLI